MRTFKLGDIVTKAKSKEGAIFIVKVEEINKRFEISLKTRSFKKGSRIYYFGMECDDSNVVFIAKDIFSEIFDGVNFKKEFKENLDSGNGYFKIWMYKGKEDEIAVIENFLHIRFNCKNWEIVNIN